MVHQEKYHWIILRTEKPKSTKSELEFPIGHNRRRQVQNNRCNSHHYLVTIFLSCVYYLHQFCLFYTTYLLFYSKILSDTLCFRLMKREIRIETICSKSDCCQTANLNILQIVDILVCIQLDNCC